MKVCEQEFPLTYYLDLSPRYNDTNHSEQTVVLYRGLIVSTFFCVNVQNSEGMSNNVTAVQDSSAACERYEYHKPQHKVTPSSPERYLDNEHKKCNKTEKCI
jgi:hypothetical protein